MRRTFWIVATASRVVTWIAVIVLTLYFCIRFETGLHLLESAPQEAAFAGMTLVEIVTVYVVARAVDRALTLMCEALA
jgi:hypothetical protein